MKEDNRLSSKIPDRLETSQVLSNHFSQVNQTSTNGLERIEPKAPGLEAIFDPKSMLVCTNISLKERIIQPQIQKNAFTGIAYARVQNQAKTITRIIYNPAFESHICSIKDKTPPDYGQVSSFFMVFGALVIIAVALINPALLLTVGVAVLCLVLFIAGIAAFFFWLRNKNNSAPWGMSYGDFALIFLLAGVVALAFAAWLVYYFSFLLLAGAIVLGILWLIHLKDKFDVPQDK